MTKSTRPRACRRGLHADTRTTWLRSLSEAGLWRSCCWLPGAVRVWRGKAAVLAPSPCVVQLRPRWGPALLAYPAPPRRLSAGRADPILCWDWHREGAQRVTFVQTSAFPAHQALCPRGLAVPCSKQGLQCLAVWSQLPSPVGPRVGMGHRASTARELRAVTGKKGFFSPQETPLRRGTFLNSMAGQEPGAENKAGHVQTGREAHTPSRGGD